MARLFLSLYDYTYEFNNDELCIHLYIDGTVEWDGVKITHTGNYPWDGELSWKIYCDRKIKVALRIPAWNGNGGYQMHEFDAGEHEIKLSLDMRVRRVYSNPVVRANVNCVALVRGPLVYCFEGNDNPEPLSALRLPHDTEISEITEESGVLKGMKVLEMTGLKAVQNKTIYSEKPHEYEHQKLKAIPYFAWANRGLNEMKVWIGELL
jgi:hypothetical protein